VDSKQVPVLRFPWSPGFQTVLKTPPKTEVDRPKASHCIAPANLAVKAVPQATNASHSPPPESILQTIKKLAKRESCSVNQFLASVATEKMTALPILNCLRTNAAKELREEFERFFDATCRKESE
jgi:hypothetical protein